MQEFFLSLLSIGGGDSDGSALDDSDHAEDDYPPTPTVTPTNKNAHRTEREDPKSAAGVQP